MTLDFPEYSDLGGVSEVTKGSWENERALRQQYRRYYDGTVFQEKVPLTTGVDNDAPLLYPVGLNLVKIVCTAQAEALFGEWDDDIIRFKVHQDVEETVSARAAITLASQIFRANNFNVMGYELGLDREVYGGSVVKVAPDLSRPGHICLSRLDLDTFYPVWDPSNIDDLLEAWIVSKITHEQVKAKYGFDPKQETVDYIEHWTKKTIEVRLGDRRMDAFSGVNPWGIVPITYIPRLRTVNWWGEALTPDIMTVQDELNMRIADLGESINYNSHPTRWGKNLPNNFNADNFPIGPGAMWDLGRKMGAAQEDAEVGMLEAKNPVPQNALDFVGFLYDWSRTAAFVPPIAFGEDDGGGQRSGRTLEIRMWPLLRATKRSRAYMAAGIRRILSIAARILAQKNLRNVSGAALQRIAEGSIVPSFWPLLPKDEQAIVDRIVKLMTLRVPALSLETAHKWLGLGPAEDGRIKAMLASPEYRDFFANPVSDAENTGTNPEIAPPKDDGGSS